MPLYLIPVPAGGPAQPKFVCDKCNRHFLEHSPKEVEACFGPPVPESVIAEAVRELESPPEVAQAGQSFSGSLNFPVVAARDFE